MPIPDYQSIMLPLLELAGDEAEHSLREAIEKLADHFHLTASERVELLPSGLQRTFDNRVGWARTYLKQAGLLESPRRGYFKITREGMEVLAKKPSRIDVTFLEKFEAFRKFRKRKRPPKKPKPSGTPEEQLEEAYQRFHDELAAELLDAVKSSSSDFFERLVVDLLVRMGYGGSRSEAGRAVGKSGDEGIDGIIKEDRLGLDVIYIQAKRWDSPIGRPELQKFAGALQGQRAKKGIFITTSSFTKEAKEYISKIESNIILIDGEQLADYMIDYGVGVASIASYEIKRLDTDYFSPDGS